MVSVAIDTSSGIPVDMEAPMLAASSAKRRREMPGRAASVLSVAMEASSGTPVDTEALALALYAAKRGYMV